MPADYDWIIEVVDGWWGRPVASSLPRLFLDHFHATSLVVEADTRDIGFLVGFHSPSNLLESYIHFVGVDPGSRRHAVARCLYDEFFALARRAGRSEVRAVTSPANSGSVAFHQALGFSVSGPVEGYNGPGTSLVAFRRAL